MSKAVITHQTSLSANVVVLCRFLRKKGFALSPTEEADALRAISFLPINKEDYFRAALKAVLSKNAHEHSLFDDYYIEFKDQLSKAADSKIKDVKETIKDKRSKAQQQEARFESLKNWLNMNPSKDEKAIASFSDLEVLTKKDFLDLNEEEMRLMMRLLQKMARKLAHSKKPTKENH